MRPQTDTRDRLVDLLFKLPSFSVSHFSCPNATEYVPWVDNLIPEGKS